LNISVSTVLSQAGPSVGLELEVGTNASDVSDGGAAILSGSRGKALKSAG